MTNFVRMLRLQVTPKYKYFAEYSAAKRATSQKLKVVVESL